MPSLVPKHGDQQQRQRSGHGDAHGSYTAENYPLKVRGRATGWVAGCSKLGGLIAQGLSVTAMIPAFDIFSPWPGHLSTDDGG